MKRRFVAGMCLVSLVLAVFCAIFYNQQLALKKEIKAQISLLQTQAAMARTYERMQRDQVAIRERLDRRPKPFSLFASINDLILDQRLKPFVVAMRPFQNDGLEGLYRQEHVELELQDVPFTRVIALIREIEKDPAWLAIKRLDLSPGKDAQRTDMVMEVVALTQPTEG